MTLLERQHMTYQEFKEETRDALINDFPESDISFRTRLMNNDKEIDSVDVSFESGITNLIYPEYYFSRMNDEGMSFGEIYSHMKSDLVKRLDFEGKGAHILSDYSMIRDRIVYELVGLDSNNERLKDLPHKNFLDMALVFRVLLSESDPRLYMTVTNAHAMKWNVTSDDLMNDARKNTRKLLPEVISRIEDIIGPVPGGGEECPKLYVLTNNRGLQGACCMIYDKVLMRFSEEVGSDVIILPSSVHEVILVPRSDDFSCSELNDMIVSVNTTELKSEDVLSDHAYIYLRTNNTIRDMSDIA
jgi:hypothetical protein